MQGLTYRLAYTLCGVVVDLRISQTVDVPKLLARALLPLDILCVVPQAEPAGRCYPRQASIPERVGPFALVLTLHPNA
jgi:hypothetical protein